MIWRIFGFPLKFNLWICIFDYFRIWYHLKPLCILWQWLQDHKSFRRKDTKNWWWTFFTLNTRPGDSYWSLTKLTSQKDSGHFYDPLQFSRSFLNHFQTSDHNLPIFFRTLKACLPIRYGSNSLTFAVLEVSTDLSIEWEFGNCGILSEPSLSSSHFSPFKDDYRYFDTHKSHQ